MTNSSAFHFRSISEIVSVLKWDLYTPLVRYPFRFAFVLDSSLDLCSFFLQIPVCNFFHRDLNWSFDLFESAFLFRFTVTIVRSLVLNLSFELWSNSVPNSFVISSEMSLYRISGLIFIWIYITYTFSFRTIIHVILESWIQLKPQLSIEDFSWTTFNQYGKRCVRVKAKHGPVGQRCVRAKHESVGEAVCEGEGETWTSRGRLNFLLESWIQLNWNVQLKSLVESWIKLKRSTEIISRKLNWIGLKRQLKV